MEDLAKDFWNIRGDFRIAHVLNIGTHMSLVRRPGGTFLLLDSYEPRSEVRDRLMALTDGGAAIEAVLNLHPFHTVHCNFMYSFLPEARHIGTRRHHERAPDLPWDPMFIEDPETQQQFADTLDFSIPSGVDFISDDPDVHVGSVIARHRASGIVHVDDTLMVLDMPSLVEKVIPGPSLRFHPKLAEGLQKRPGAADDFAAWARGLALAWSDTTKICAAHKGIANLTDQSLGEAIEAALEHVSGTLDEHRKTYG